jgi:DNA-binding NarL/FixJ family response regulator
MQLSAVEQAAAAWGETNGEIAHELKIGVETVRTHTANILRKLGVRSRRALRGIAEHR